MMSRLSTLLSVICAVLALSYSNAFAPSSQIMKSLQVAQLPSIGTSINMGFGMPDEETKKLTRENEPDEYFSTNLDKMSDQEKLPIAIGGFLFISLPFVAGLIALYASK